MKFFVDTADVDAIAELNELGMVDGVTTNPSLILKSGRDILEVTKEIAGMVDGPVSAEVVALKADDMIAEAANSRRSPTTSPSRCRSHGTGSRRARCSRARATWST